jgi:hypothetical protein
MRTFLITISLLAILVSPVFGEFEVTAKNLENAFEIPGSRSPDGVYALYCINRGLTTATFIGIMPTTRESLGLETKLFQHGSDKKEYKQFFKVVWTSDSSLVAAHDSSKRHSELFVYKIQNGSIAQLNVPDLVSIMKTTLPENIEIRSSGQIPIRWVSPTELIVLVRLKDKSGKLHTERYRIDPVSGVIAINTKK